jgi:hypothetical protein
MEMSVTRTVRFECYYIVDVGGRRLTVDGDVENFQSRDDQPRKLAEFSTHDDAVRAGMNALVSRPAPCEFVVHAIYRSIAT